MPTVTIWHASWCAPCRGTLRDLVPELEDEGIEPLTFDYQSERHRSKTIEAKSPLQGTALLASIYHSTFYKVQVNHSFTLVIINHIIRPSLEKKYWNIRKKDVLEEHFQPPFR